MAKLKIGDKVKILDGSKIDNYTGGWYMTDRIGEIHEIASFENRDKNRVAYKLKDSCCTYDERGLELVCHKFEVGDKVIAKKSANGIYTLTKEGWIGKVTNVCDEKLRVCGKVEDWGDDLCFIVDAKDFEPYNENTAKFSFKTEENYRIDKTCNKKIPTITTTIYIGDADVSASATCDKSEYEEREGILNAIANSVCGGNFDREYEKFKSAQKKAYMQKCKCKKCGKLFATPEDARACEQAHIQHKKEKYEKYLIQKEAKRKLAEAEHENKVNDMMRKLSVKKGK